jgi:hypothetical protein
MSPLKCPKNSKNGQIVPYFAPKTTSSILREIWPHDFQNWMLIGLVQLQRKRKTKNLAQKIFILASLRRFLRFGQNTAFAVPNRVRDFFQVCFKLFWENVILNHLEQSVWFIRPWNHPGGPKPFLRSWRFTKKRLQHPYYSGTKCGSWIEASNAIILMLWIFKLHWQNISNGKKHPFCAAFGHDYGTRDSEFLDGSKVPLNRLV